ncbi:MAG: PAS domain S-box protein, partial [Bacteroidota bacterium]|nr:PAS domain S-box protein [Bacteroidota bacterium]
MSDKPTYKELEKRVKQLEHEKTNIQNTNNEKLSKLIKYAPLGISTNSLDGKFLSVNNEYCKITGYTEKELLKLRFIDITVEEYHEMNLNFLIDNLLKEKI